VVFCTLFNQYYLTRGLALYRSLKAACPDFTLYVFAFDDATYNHIGSINDERLIAVSLAEFEDAELLKVKPTRSFAEYCWTSTSSTLLWVLKNTAAGACTYIDADMYFYNDPSLLLEEMTETESVIITSHNYTPRYDQSALSGKYCVQFMHFKNDVNGIKVLEWWRERCIEWCYNRHEDGKFGDQKYLDVWPAMFDGICDLQHKGLLAPWNVQQFTISEKHDNYIVEISTNNEFPLVFFHFHGVKYYANNKFIYAPRSYQLSKAFKKKYYQPYCNLLLSIQAELNVDGMGTQKIGAYLKDFYLKGHLANFKRNFLKK
jgi:hypothetical protein